MSDHNTGGPQPSGAHGSDAAALVGPGTLDLTEVDIPNQAYPCRIHCDVIGRPETIDIELPHTAQSWNALTNNPESVRGKLVTVQLSDGRTMRAKVEMFIGWNGDLTATMWGQFHISDSVIAHAAPHDGDHWRIRLTNVRIPRGDRTTRVAHGNGMLFLHGTIIFHAGGREWVLTDEWEQRWRDDPKPDTSKPLPSGRLETAYQPGDTREVIETIVEEIEALLRIALCRGISWFTCELIAGARVVELHHSSRWMKPFNVGDSQIISNALPYQLKAFLEAAYPRFVANREWFMVTALLYVISRMGSHLEIRASLLNTLLDRIAAKVLENDDTAEIDADMPRRMTKPWRRRLHALMLEVSPHWTQDRTGRLVGNIKEWNESPSFPGGVERAAVRLGLWPPSKGHLVKRHKLIHLGEYDDENGIGVFDYWREIECLVTMMLLRMLGYSGVFYHLALGDAEQPLSALLLAGTESPPYRVQNILPDNVADLTEVGAHRLWEERGKPLGDDWADWFPAEENITRVLATIAPAQRTRELDEK